MAIGLVGRKCGMTRVFTDAGETVPVTVVEVLPNRVTQVKSADKDAIAPCRSPTASVVPSCCPRPPTFRQGECRPGKALLEFRLQGIDGADLKPGSELKVDLLHRRPDGRRHGRDDRQGLAGTMKRHNFAGHHATHGVSVSHRTPGSIGQRQTPGRVFPGKRMSGPHGLFHQIRRRVVHGRFGAEVAQHGGHACGQ